MSNSIARNERLRTRKRGQGIRSSSGVQGNAGAAPKYERGQDQPYATPFIPARFRVEVPRGHRRYVEFSQNGRPA